MLDDFFTRALISGIGVAIVTGPLGCFIVWRRLAYFGDTLSHSALLGVALALLLEVNITLAVSLFPFCGFCATFVAAASFSLLRYLARTARAFNFSHWFGCTCIHDVGPSRSDGIFVWRYFVNHGFGNWNNLVWRFLCAFGSFLHMARPFCVNCELRGCSC